MKKSFVLIALLLFTFATTACAQEPEAAAPAKPESMENRASYAIGMNMGRSMKEQEVPIDLDLLIQGIKDGLSGGETLLTDEEMQSAMQEFQQMMMQKAQEKQAKQADENKAAADEFFAANKDKEGVQTTESGLQYQIITEGDGPKPTAEDQVTVHYVGTLLDGTKFDSSIDRGQPATFPVSGVIAGWTEALQMMPVGSKWKLWIPPDLAYGPRGQGPIPPNSTLVFEVELLSIGDQNAGNGGNSGGGGR